MNAHVWDTDKSRNLKEQCSKIRGFSQVMQLFVEDMQAEQQKEKAKQLLSEQEQQDQESKEHKEGLAEKEKGQILHKVV